MSRPPGSNNVAKLAELAEVTATLREPEDRFTGLTEREKDAFHAYLARKQQAARQAATWEGYQSWMD